MYRFKIIIIEKYTQAGGASSWSADNEDLMRRSIFFAAILGARRVWLCVVQAHGFKLMLPAQVQNVFPPLPRLCKLLSMEDVTGS